MALARTGNQGYRDYLRSGAWGWRRQRWFRDCRRRGFEPACQVCRVMLCNVASLDLHHVSYDGVQQNDDGTWTAGEADEDLMPMCRQCHQELHQRLDRPGDYTGWDRRRATVVIIGNMRKAFERGRAGWIAVVG